MKSKDIRIVAGGTPEEGEEGVIFTTQYIKSGHASDTRVGDQNTLEPILPQNVLALEVID